MSWKKHIFKPRWQHKDAGIRAQAVASLDDPELLSQLPSILLGDEAPEVRSAAARRVDDITTLKHALDKEADPGNIRLLSTRLTEQSLSINSESTDGQVLSDWLSSCSDRNTLEKISSSATDARFRMAVLDKIDRQGFLGDRAIQDPDAEVRAHAASRVKQHSTLQRVIDQVRKTDKALHQALTIRLKQELIEAGDRKTIEAEALSLCEEAEHHALTNLDQAGQVPSHIEQRWQAISDKVSAELVQRFDSARERIETRIEPTTPEEPKPTPKQEPLVETEDQAATDSITERDPSEALIQEFSLSAMELIKLAAHKRPARKLGSLKVQWRKLDLQSSHARHSELLHVLTRLQQDQQEIEQQTARLNEKAQQYLATYREALEEGNLKSALNARKSVLDLKQKLADVNIWNAMQAQLTGHYARLKELRDWQHWANDKVRKELIREMELLPKTDLHPDAVLDRIKELQTRWKALEDTEQIPGERRFAAAGWMWKKFQLAGNQAFNATKPFLDSRSKIHEERASQIDNQAQELSKLASTESADRVKINASLKAARSSLQELDAFPQGMRNRLSRKLHAAISSANKAIQAQYELIEKEKRKLIRSAEQLAHLEDRDEAIARAKQLQSAWKKAGALWRKRENELWNEFRAPLDPLFDSLKKEHEQSRERREQQTAQQRALLDQLKSILELPDDELDQSSGKVHGLAQEMAEFGNGRSAESRQFSELQTEYEKRLANQQAEVARLARIRWWQKAESLHAVETALATGSADASELVKNLEQNWQHNDQTKIDKVLDGRYAALKESNSVSSADPDLAPIAQNLCIQLEFLAGLPSPPEDRDARMTYQVERLSQNMSGGGQSMSAVEEAEYCERQWLTLALLDDDLYQPAVMRIRNALEEIVGAF